MSSTGNGRGDPARDCETTIEENDATHKRLRITNYEECDTKCLSCNETFQSRSILEVIEHYQEKHHHEFYTKCNYCHGKIHRYKKNGLVDIYHNCARSKQGLDT